MAEKVIIKKIFIRKLIDRTFEIGILIKSIFGFFEVLAGIVLAVSGRLIVNNLIIALTQQEIAEDPKDIIANFLIKAASNFYLGGQFFAVIYLIFHGSVDIFLAMALLKNKIWAYPWAITGFSIFLVYQAYKYYNSNSLLLLLLSLFDIFIILIVLLEYRKKKIIRKI